MPCVTPQASVPPQTSTTVYSNIAIRGINVENRGNYRLNGTLPIVNLIDLPLEDKDRVEALKGASALYYGFTAPSGIINLTMKRPTPDPYVAATLFGNEYGPLGGHVDASNTWGPFGARINARVRQCRLGHRQYARPSVTPRSRIRFQAERQPDAQRGCRAHPEGRQRAGRVPLHPAPDADACEPVSALHLPPLLDPDHQLRTGLGLESRGGAQYARGGTGRFRRPGRSRRATATRTWCATVTSTRSISTPTAPATNGDGAAQHRQQPGATFDNSNYRVELAGALNAGSMKHQFLVGASQNIRDASTR